MINALTLTGLILILKNNNIERGFQSAELALDSSGESTVTPHLILWPCFCGQELARCRMLVTVNTLIKQAKAVIISEDKQRIKIRCRGSRSQSSNQDGASLPEVNSRLPAAGEEMLTAASECFITDSGRMKLSWDMTRLFGRETKKDCVC